MPPRVFPKSGASGEREAGVLSPPQIDLEVRRGRGREGDVAGLVELTLPHLDELAPQIEVSELQPQRLANA